MKWLSIIFSVLTLYFLVSHLFLQDDTMGEDKALASISTFAQPNKNTEKLTIEADWLIDQDKLTAQKAAEKNKITEKTVVTKPAQLYPTLTIAGIDYQLLGIFKGKNLPFILIKANKQPIIKVIEGSELSPGIILQQVLANKITLSNAGNTIEFKLFEPITHA